MWLCRAQKRLLSPSVCDYASDQLLLLLRNDHLCSSARPPHHFSRLLRYHQQRLDYQHHHPRCLNPQYRGVPGEWPSLRHSRTQAHPLRQFNYYLCKLNHDALCWLNLSWTAALEMWRRWQYLRQPWKASSRRLRS